MSSSASPKRIAWAITRSRSGVGLDSAATTARAFSATRRALAAGSAPGPIEGSGGPTPSMAISSKPVSPVSSEASAFWSDSWMVRPIAIASPTDFIEVVSSGSAPGNFSKAKRGIFVTT